MYSSEALIAQQLQQVWFEGHHVYGFSIDWLIGIDSYSNDYIIIRIPDDKRETHANLYGKIEYVTLLTPTDDLSEKHESTIKCHCRDV